MTRYYTFIVEKTDEGLSGTCKGKERTLIVSGTDIRILRVNAAKEVSSVIGEEVDPFYIKLKLPPLP